jgi:putative transposase
MGSSIDKTIAKAGIVHFFTYPRCPKQNGVVERFNRTLQEDCVEKNRELLEGEDPKAFNNELIDYLLFYNTERPHDSLEGQEPMKAVIKYLKKSNRYGTDTKTSKPI